MFDAVAHVLDDVYALRGRLTSLPGEFDVNARLDTPAGPLLVRVSRPDERPAVVVFQNSMLGHLQASGIASSQRVVPSSAGDPVAYLDDGRIMRVFTWIDGAVLAAARPAHLR